MKFKLLAIFLLVSAASAQEKPAIGGHVPDAPSMHKFWNTEDKIDFSIFAGQLATDAITERFERGFQRSEPADAATGYKRRGRSGHSFSTKFRRWSGNRLFAPCNAPLPCRAPHATPYSRRRGCFGRAQYRAAEWAALVSHAVLRGAILSVHGRGRESAV